MNNYEKKLKELDLNKGDYVRASENFKSGSDIYYFSKDSIYQLTRKDDHFIYLEGYQVGQEHILKIDKVHIVEDCTTQELKDIVKKREKMLF